MNLASCASDQSGSAREVALFTGAVLIQKTCALLKFSGVKPARGGIAGESGYSSQAFAAHTYRPGRAALLGFSRRRARATLPSIIWTFPPRSVSEAT